MTCDIVSEFGAMTEALWRHALGFLDRHGARAGQHWEELYEFSDKTGILERHKQLLARPGHSAEVRHPRNGGLVNGKCEL